MASGNMVSQHYDSLVGRPVCMLHCWLFAEERHGGRQHGGVSALYDLRVGHGWQAIQISNAPLHQTPVSHTRRTALPPPLHQLVKVICKAPTFMTAVQKMQRALYEFHIRGVKVGGAAVQG